MTRKGAIALREDLAGDVFGSMVEMSRARKTVVEAHAAGPDHLLVGELIPLAQAAQAAGLTPGSLREYARQGRLVARKVGRDWLTTAEAVRAYLESRDMEKIPRRYRDRT